MSYDSDFADMLRRMGRKEPPAGYYIGPVVSLSPLTIALMDGEVMATGPFLRVSETVQRCSLPCRTAYLTAASAVETAITPVFRRRSRSAIR